MQTPLHPPFFCSHWHHPSSLPLSLWPLCTHTQVRLLPCMHEFCKECIGEWIERQGLAAACPLCKRMLIPRERGGGRSGASPRGPDGTLATPVTQPIRPNGNYRGRAGAASSSSAVTPSTAALLYTPEEEAPPQRPSLDPLGVAEEGSAVSVVMVGETAMRRPSAEEVAVVPVATTPAPPSPDSDDSVHTAEEEAAVEEEEEKPQAEEVPEAPAAAAVEEDPLAGGPSTPTAEEEAV